MERGAGVSYGYFLREGEDLAVAGYYCRGIYVRRCQDRVDRPYRGRFCAIPNGK